MDLAKPCLHELRGSEFWVYGSGLGCGLRVWGFDRVDRGFQPPEFTSIRREPKVGSTGQGVGQSILFRWHHPKPYPFHKLNPWLALDMMKLTVIWNFGIVLTNRLLLHNERNNVARSNAYYQPPSPWKITPVLYDPEMKGTLIRP